MTKQPSLRPPFDVEFPDSERNLPDHIESAIERGTLTPAMVGYRSPTTGEAKIPLSADEADEADELRKSAEAFAEIHGGHPDDYDWRYQ